MHTRKHTPAGDLYLSTWMTHKALKAVKHRRLIYNKYKDSRHPAYVKAAKLASYLIKQARQNFEELLAKNIKEDRKSFFAYARSKSKCNVRVGDLSNNQGQMVSDAVENVELLWLTVSFHPSSPESLSIPFRHLICASQVVSVSVSATSLLMRLSLQINCMP